MQQLHRNCFEAHVDLVKEEWGYSPRDWWHRYEDEDAVPVEEEKLKKLNFHAFYRCYPERNQDIAVVGANPKFDPDGPGHGAFEFAELAGDFEAIQTKAPETMKKYFVGDKRGSWLGVYKGSDENIDEGGVFRPLATETDYFDDEEYLDCGFYSDDFYDVVYYTNLFKFGSGRFDELPDTNAAAECGEKFLKKELERVDPEAVIMLGGHTTDLIGSGNVGEIHGTHQEYAGFDVIPHHHPSMYNSNKSKEKYNRYKKTITELLG